MVGNPERTAAPDTPYRELLQKTSDALFVVNGKDRFDVVNRAFLELVGYDREEILGTAPTAILGPQDEAEWQRRVRLLRTETETETETWLARLITKTGTEAPVEFDVSVVEEGADGRLVGVVRDVRKQQRQEQKLDVLNRALRHNIRNRMNIVLGKASALQDIDDEGYRTAAAQIETVGKEIINISDKARKAQKYLGIPRDEDCETELVALTERVVVKFTISHPEATVTTDLPDVAHARAPPSFEVALMELLENGVVHHRSGNGPVTVAIERHGERIAVQVNDECDPIPDSVVECLEEATEQPLKHNEGIGLWLVQWAVDTVGGEIAFDRRPDDTGNVVTLTFDAIED